MGEGVEEKKNEEVKNEEEQQKKEEKKEADEEPDREIVLKVDMHCQACARKIARALIGFEGVKDVRADSKVSMVVVKGKSNIDPIKVSERIQKKSGRKVQIISPLPPNPAAAQETDKPAEQKEAKKEKPSPPVTTAVLEIRMHCEACAQVLKKRIRKMRGVESVRTDLANGKVTITGILHLEKLEDEIYKKTRRHASIVMAEAAKDEEKKEEEVKKEGEGEGEKIEVQEDQKSEMIKRHEYWPPPTSHPIHYIQEQYAYAPQFFSDDNPNSCAVM